MRLMIDKQPEGTRSPNLVDAVVMAGRRTTAWIGCDIRMVVETDRYPVGSATLRDEKWPPAEPPLNAAERGGAHP